MDEEELDSSRLLKSDYDPRNDANEHEGTRKRCGLVSVILCSFRVTRVDRIGFWFDSSFFSSLLKRRAATAGSPPTLPRMRPNSYCLQSLFMLVHVISRIGCTFTRTVDPRAAHTINSIHNQPMRLFHDNLSALILATVGGSQVLSTSIRSGIELSRLSPPAVFHRKLSTKREGTSHA